MESLFVLLLLSGIFWGSSAVSRQFNYINLQMSWPDAQSYCRERFTDLATVDTMDDVNRLLNSVDAGYSGSVWIGLKSGTEKRWSWSNGENSSQYFNWASGMPNDDGYCVATYSGSWIDMPCNLGRYFVCYKNTTYYMIQSAGPIPWTEAQSYCRQYYTDLPTIHSSAENDNLTAAVLRGWYIWIGLYRDTWEWSDQWDLQFRYWAIGQPNQRVGPDCVSMSTADSGKWRQERCNVLHPFICYAEEKRKQIIRLKLSCAGKCQLNDPSLQTAILNQITETLISMGLESDSTINVRNGGVEEVFHLENNGVENSKRKCKRYP
ncbi:macrophage mannose receptor 1 [Danio aesculapii]|uniref:macrophage mannose receptor 1 n=1 Tax=Danio aesculapii TaxID=1142201 RepID=UPI0024BFC706|nr:macrophage mannose receptor 1 [Danio aesculapii]